MRAHPHKPYSVIWECPACLKVLGESTYPPDPKLRRHVNSTTKMGQLVIWRRRGA